MLYLVDDWDADICVAIVPSYSEVIKKKWYTYIRREAERVFGECVEEVPGAAIRCGGNARVVTTWFYGCCTNMPYMSYVELTKAFFKTVYCRQVYRRYTAKIFYIAVKEDKKGYRKYVMECTREWFREGYYKMIPYKEAVEKNAKIKRLKLLETRSLWAGKKLELVIAGDRSLGVGYQLVIDHILKVAYITRNSYSIDKALAYALLKARPKPEDMPSPCNRLYTKLCIDRRKKK